MSGYVLTRAVRTDQLYAPAQDGRFQVFHFIQRVPLEYFCRVDDRHAAVQLACFQHAHHKLFRTSLDGRTSWRVGL